MRIVFKKIFDHFFSRLKEVIYLVINYIMKRKMPHINRYFN